MNAVRLSYLVVTSLMGVQLGWMVAMTIYLVTANEFGIRDQVDICIPFGVFGCLLGLLNYQRDSSKNVQGFGSLASLVVVWIVLSATVIVVLLAAIPAMNM